jgi:nitroimidazol reductase NimA-like FMN-containing flavoprotein (pyridoxamine 5'-phosphate oxidase superfamily)
MLTPVASRPTAPEGYGIKPADEGAGLLPWSWADERLRGRYIWWLATTRPDGQPHLMPIWAVWLGDGVAFSTGRGSRKEKNLARDARVSVTPERGEESVIIEGVAEELAAARFDEFVAAYKDVWDFDPTPMAHEPTFLVRPSTVFGFIDSTDPEATNGFPNSATRWTFS